MPKTLFEQLREKASRLTPQTAMIESSVRGENPRGTLQRLASSINPAFHLLTSNAGRQARGYAKLSATDMIKPISDTVRVLKAARDVDNIASRVVSATSKIPKRSTKPQSSSQAKSTKSTSSASGSTGGRSRITTTSVSESTPQTTQQVQQPVQQPAQQPVYVAPYRSTFDYSQGARGIGGLGIKDYAGLVNFVGANPNHPLAQDLVHRFGAVNEWSKDRVEGELGVKGRYGRGILGGGDLSDIVRSMAKWAGDYNGRADRQGMYHWEQGPDGRFIQVAGPSSNGYGAGAFTGNTYYNGTPTTATVTTTERFYNPGYEGTGGLNFSNRDQVVAYQRTLQDAGLGNLLGEAGADGIWGQNTQRAHEAFQAQRAMREVGNQAKQNGIITSSNPSKIVFNEDGTISRADESLSPITDRSKLGKFHKGGLISKDPIERFKRGGKKKREVQSTAAKQSTSPSEWKMRTGTKPNGTSLTQEELNQARRDYADAHVENDRLEGYHWDLDENGNYVWKRGASKNGYAVTNPYTENPEEVYAIENHPDYSANNGTVMYTPTYNPNAAITLVQQTIPVNDENNNAISKFIRTYKGKKV